MKERGKRIMIFGTFDGLHPGHLNLFKQARDLAGESFLIVSIARDKNVLRIKGRIPRKNEKKRLAEMRKSRLADKVVLAGLNNHIPHIIKLHPDIIALGYDQKYYIKNLKEDLKKRRLSVKIARLKPFKEKVYKSHLLKNLHQTIKI